MEIPFVNFIANQVNIIMVKIVQDVELVVKSVQIMISVHNVRLDTYLRSQFVLRDQN